MAQEDNQNDNDDNNEQQQAPAPLSLDDVHAEALSDLEGGDDDDSSNDDGTNDDSDDNQDDSNDAGDDDDSGDDNADDDDEEEDDDDSEDEEEDEEDETPLEDRRTQLDEVTKKLNEIVEDNDVTKPGELKTEFKDFSGKSYYVRSEDDLPDDFEPASSKELMKSMGELNKNRSTLLSRIQDAKKDAEKIAYEERIAEQVKEVQATWKKEIKTLKLDDQDTINKVYNLMADWNNKGTPIGSFTAAYEIFKGEKTDDKNKDEKKNKQKKNKGSRVMGSNAPSKKSGPIENDLPRGMTLDELHNSIVNEFE